MILRELVVEDAPRMLSWMHDSEVVEKLQADFASKTIEDCIKFIEDSHNNRDNLHLAICNDDGMYIGTISLKHMDGESAEFGITIGRDGMGTGIAANAMEQIINLGRKEYGILYIYWCVHPDNVRALRFYDKNGYKRIESGDIPTTLHYTEEQINTYIWYMN